MVLQGPYVRQTLPLDQQDSVHGEIIAISDISFGTQEKTVPPRTARRMHSANGYTSLQVSTSSKGGFSNSLVVDDCARQREPESLTGARGRPRRTESGEVEIGGCHRGQVPNDAELVQSAQPPCSILRQTLLPHAGSAPDTSRRHLRIPRRRLRENEPA